MNLHYQYYWFKEVIPHDMCDKIIQMGNKRIKQSKNNGNDASGTTSGGTEKKKDERISSKELQPKEQLETDKDKHARNNEVAWFNEQRTEDSELP